MELVETNPVKNSTDNDHNNEDVCFLGQSTPERVKPKKSRSMFRTVRNVMIATKATSSNLPPSNNGTPRNTRRTQSSASQVSFKGRQQTSPDKHDVNCTCDKCNYSGWIPEVIGLDHEDDDDEQNVNGGVCLLTDSPHYIFTLARQGNVKQLAALCNATPDRLYSVDRKGATILHHSAAADQARIIQFALCTPGGTQLLSMMDDSDATALHWAIENDASKSVEVLLQRGADPYLANNCGYGALHYAVQKSAIDSLKVILRSEVDKDHKGMSGLTALHVAAYSDNDVAFKALLDAGAKPCMACSQGYRPLHTAAITGSKKVMRLVLDQGEKYGYSREQLLSFGDKEMSSPLHCAVTGGNICAIRVCLEYGARLDVRQADDSTPMHMVCGQGNLDVVKLMFEIAPEQARSTLFMCDKRDHTPLHK